MKHQEVLENCPSCGNGLFSPFLNAIDYTVSRETFSIVSCDNCGLKFTNPRPNISEIGKYYESEDYVSHSNTKSGFINKIYHAAKKLAIRNKIELIESLPLKNKKIIDIGCGTGSFLGEIQKRGWKAIGIEPNEKARNLAKSDYGLNVLEENAIQTLDKNSFAVATMWHVLEHVHNLKERIVELWNLLEDGGFAVIAVPNCTAWDAKFYRDGWAAYDVPRHLYHFSPEVIKNIFHQKGFTHYRSLPMKMDSFYVSMLSEKYKKSSLGIIKAFINGLRSNINAKNDPEKYSSVIYIFKK